MSQLVLDTHVLYWLWAGDTARISPLAMKKVDEADELLVAAITWYELALLFERGRVALVDMTPKAALESMAARVGTAPLSWSIARRAAALEQHEQFPRDPADRLIFATAQEREAGLVTADGRLRQFNSQICVW